MSETTIAYLTAGAAGMYCGSCMHDNTLARALARQGVDIQLIPTYTPIRTDEENVSIDHIFYGGVNVYLEQRFGWFRWLSPLVGPLLDRPWLLRQLSRRASSTDPRLLGPMTVSLLRGTAGHQRHEVLKLCQWLASSLRPRLVVFSNLLIAGCLPELQRQWPVPALVTLQGDDIFLAGLPPADRELVQQEMAELVPLVDGFLVHSRYYGDYMAELLGLPREKIFQVPLGIDIDGYETPPVAERSGRTIGYLARLAPEKGLHVLVDAFLELRRRPETKDVRLAIAGWLGEAQRPYWQAQLDRIRAAGADAACEYWGSVDRSQKIAFLQQLDLFSVPTTYREPKGLFVLEALAAGVPVVLPAHGAFPELLADLAGGVLFPPEQPQALADRLAELLNDPPRRAALGQQGQAAVRHRYHAAAMAQATWSVWQQFVGGSSSF